MLGIELLKINELKGKKSASTSKPPDIGRCHSPEGGHTLTVGSLQGARNCSLWDCGIHLCLKILHFRKCDVLNRGFSGYNTRWAKIILPRLIKKGTGLDSPVAVTIFFGANDSALKGKGIFVFS